jgi:hypothetical protein
MAPPDEFFLTPPVFVIRPPPELVIGTFAVIWLIGGVLCWFAFRLTRAQPEPLRSSVRTLTLAVAFTPSVIIFHGWTPAPAVIVLIWFPFERGYGWPYALAFGAVPIAVVWAALKLTGSMGRRRA